MTPYLPLPQKAYIVIYGIWDFTASEDPRFRRLHTYQFRLLSVQYSDTREREPFED